MLVFDISLLLRVGTQISSGEILLLELEHQLIEVGVFVLLFMPVIQVHLGVSLVHHFVLIFVLFGHLVHQFVSLRARYHHLVILESSFLELISIFQLILHALKSLVMSPKVAEFLHLMDRLNLLESLLLVLDPLHLL